MIEHLEMFDHVGFFFTASSTVNVPPTGASPQFRINHIRPTSTARRWNWTSKRSDWNETRLSVRGALLVGTCLGLSAQETRLKDQTPSAATTGRR